MPTELQISISAASGELPINIMLKQLVYKKWCIIRRMRKFDVFAYVYKCKKSLYSMDALLYYPQTGHFSKIELGYREIGKLVISNRCELITEDRQQFKNQYAKFLLRNGDIILTEEEFPKIKEEYEH